MIYRPGRTSSLWLRVSSDVKKRKKEQKKRKQKKLTDNDTLSFVLSSFVLYLNLGSFSQSPDDTSIMTPLLANSLGLTGVSHKS